MECLGRDGEGGGEETEDGGKGAEEEEGGEEEFRLCRDSRVSGR